MKNLGDVARMLGREERGRATSYARGHYPLGTAGRAGPPNGDDNSLPQVTRPGRFAASGWPAAKLGDPAGATADARRALRLLEGLQSHSGEDSFEEGCCHALLASLAGRDGAGRSAADSEAETAQAMALLRKTVGMGYRDTSGFRTDSALDPLRQREDFQKLLEELEKKSPAKPN